MAEQESPKDFIINEKLNNSNLQKSPIYPNQSGVGEGWGEEVEGIKSDTWKIPIYGREKKEKNRCIEIAWERKY